MSELLHGEVTKPIIKAFYHVYNTLGYGFLERVYENSLAISIRKAELKVEQQKPINVYFEGEAVGEYFADLIVADCVIIELKAVEAIEESHEAPLLNYLKATDIEVGLLVNFGPKLEFRRKIFHNHLKDRSSDPF